MSQPSLTSSPPGNSRIEAWLDASGGPYPNDQRLRAPSEAPRPLKRRRIADSEERDLAANNIPEPRTSSPSRKAKRAKTATSPARNGATQPEASPEGSRELSHDENGEIRQTSSGSNPCAYRPRSPIPPDHIVDPYRRRTPTPSLHRSGPARRRLPRHKEALEQLKKPIRYYDWSEVLKTKATFQKGTELRDLIDRLASIDGGCGILPRSLQTELRPLLERDTPRKVIEANMYDDPRPMKELRRELEDLLEILDAQNQLTDEGGYKLTWNENVWSRFLRRAVKVVPNVAWHNMNTPPIEDSLLPYLESTCPVWARRLKSRPVPPKGKRDWREMNNKFLDYAVAIVPKPRAAEAIRTSLLERSRSEHFVSINPICHLGFVERPIAVPIAAMGYENEHGQDGYMQLAYYASAWHKFFEDPEMARMLPLVSLKKTPLPCLPMIEIQGGGWYLYLAFDDVETGEIGITKLDAALGWTDCLYQMYKLLASLRVLLRWADGPYRAWWDSRLGVGSATASTNQES